MAAGLQNIFDVPELKRKLGWTFLIVIIYRIGGHITVPGIAVNRLMEWFSTQQDTFFGLMDMFVGGGLQRATVFALGIMPYISASIIFQLLPPVFPYFEKLQKEGEEGRKKITQYTRYCTVVLSFIQSVAIATWLMSLGAVTMENAWLFRVSTVVTLTTGAANTLGEGLGLDFNAYTELTAAGEGTTSAESEGQAQLSFNFGAASQDIVFNFMPEASNGTTQSAGTRPNSA